MATGVHSQPRAAVSGPSRHAATAARRRGRPPLIPVLLSAAITAAVIAWGVLVVAAIDFGRAATLGGWAEWALLALATVGAICCLLIAVLLGSQLIDRLRTTPTPAPARPVGGKRRAR